MIKYQVIVVTDGDQVAQKAVETAAASLNLRTISSSGGNPTPLSGKELADLVRQAASYPVVVMFDDRGKSGLGKGESSLLEFAQEEDIEIIGVLAVASNCRNPDAVSVLFSIDRNNQLVPEGVDKYGYRHTHEENAVYGDTLAVLRIIDVPVVGIGDIGKMDGHDDVMLGVPITRKALEEILKLNGIERTEASCGKTKCL